MNLTFGQSILDSDPSDKSLVPSYWNQFRSQPRPNVSGTRSPIEQKIIDTNELMSELDKPSWGESVRIAFAYETPLGSLGGLSWTGMLGEEHEGGTMGPGADEFGGLDPDYIPSADELTWMLNSGLHEDYQEDVIVAAGNPEHFRALVSHYIHIESSLQRLHDGDWGTVALMGTNVVDPIYLATGVGIAGAAGRAGMIGARSAFAAKAAGATSRAKRAAAAMKSAGIAVGTEGIVGTSRMAWDPFWTWDDQLTAMAAAGVFGGAIGGTFPRTIYGKGWADEITARDMVRNGATPEQAQQFLDSRLDEMSQTEQDLLFADHNQIRFENGQRVDPGMRRVSVEDIPTAELIDLDTPESNILREYVDRVLRRKGYTDADLEGDDALEIFQSLVDHPDPNMRLTPGEKGWFTRRFKAAQDAAPPIQTEPTRVVGTVDAFFPPKTPGPRTPEESLLLAIETDGPHTPLNAMDNPWSRDLRSFQKAQVQRGIAEGRLDPDIDLDDPLELTSAMYELDQAGGLQGPVGERYRYLWERAADNEFTVQLEGTPVPTKKPRKVSDDVSPEDLGGERSPAVYDFEEATALREYYHDILRRRGIDSDVFADDIAGMERQIGVLDDLTPEEVAQLKTLRDAAGAAEDVPRYVEDGLGEPKPNRIVEGTDEARSSRGPMDPQDIKRPVVRGGDPTFQPTATRQVLEDMYNISADAASARAGGSSVRERMDEIPEGDLGDVPYQETTWAGRLVGRVTDGPAVGLARSTDPAARAAGDVLVTNPLARGNRSLYSATARHNAAFNESIADWMSEVGSLLRRMTTGARERKLAAISRILRDPNADLSKLNPTDLAIAKATRAHMKRLWEIAKKAGLKGVPDEFDPNWFPRTWSPSKFGRFDRLFGHDTVDKLLVQSLKDGLEKRGTPWTSKKVEQLATHVSKLMRDQNYKDLQMLRQHAGKGDAFSVHMAALKDQFEAEGLERDLVDDILDMFAPREGETSPFRSANTRLPFDETTRITDPKTGQEISIMDLINHDLESNVIIYTSRLQGHLQWRKAMAKLGHDPDISFSDFIRKQNIRSHSDSQKLRIIFNDLHQLSQNPYIGTWWAEGIRQAKDLTAGTRGGLMGFASWNEAASTASWLGLKYALSFFPKFANLINLIETGQWADYKAFQVFAKMHGKGYNLNNRAYSTRMHTGDHYRVDEAIGGAGIFARTGRAVAQQTGRITTDFRRVTLGRANPAGTGRTQDRLERGMVYAMMDWWANAVWKVGDDGTIQSIKGGSKSLLDKIRRMGITDDRLLAIRAVLDDPSIVSAAPKKFMGVVPLPNKNRIVEWNFDSWPQHVLDDFMDLNLSMMDRIIQRADIGDVPTYFNRNPIWGALFQFMTHPMVAMNKKTRYHFGQDAWGGRQMLHYFGIGMGITYLAWISREEVKMMGVGMSEAQKAERRKRYSDPATVGLTLWQMSDSMGLTADLFSFGSRGALGLDPWYPQSRRSGGFASELLATPPMVQTLDNLQEGITEAATGDILQGLHKGVFIRNVIGLPQLYHQLGIK